MTHQATSPDITSRIRIYTRILIAFWTTAIVLFIWFQTFYAHEESLALAQKIESIYTQNRSGFKSDIDFSVDPHQFILHERNEIFIYAFSLSILWGIGLAGVIWGSKRISAQFVELISMQKELTESENRFRTFLNHISDPLYIFDLQGRIIDCNHTACKSTGYTYQEMLLLNISDIDTAVKGEDEVRALWDSMEADHPIDISGTHKRKDTTTYPVEIRITKIQYKDDMIMIGLARDLTQRKQMEQKLEEQRQQTIHIDRLHALGEMAAGVAHELNQPLAAISAISEGLCLRIESGMAVSNQKLVDEMTDVLLLIDRMVGIINHMRIFSRDTTNDPPITFQISEVIENALKFVHAQLKSHSIQIDLRIAERLPACNGWPNQMEEVILNLLINARDALDQKRERYTIKNGTPWQPQISIEAKEVENSIQIDLSDNGNGIPEDVIDKIFNPFFTTKEVGKGTGLGLSISKSLVEKHGGTLNVYNHPNTSVTFSISVPVENPKPEHENQPIPNYTT